MLKLHPTEQKVFNRFRDFSDEAYSAKEIAIMFNLTEKETENVIEQLLLNYLITQSGDIFLVAKGWGL